jgi:signal transduction histidine kinase
MMNQYVVPMDGFGEVIAARMQSETTSLAALWLERLTALVVADKRDIFPGEHLLDHIPALVTEIAKYVVTPEVEEIAANTAVIEKARELGLLRHEQRASLHQLLREYELLDEILTSFVEQEAAQMNSHVPVVEGLRVARRIDRAVHALMRVTVETFVSEYIETLKEQEQRLEKFRHMASHELRNPIGTLMFATRLLREAPTTDPKHWTRLVENIERNVERVAHLLNNLQHLSGDVLAADSPTEQAVDVTALARDVARQLRSTADARGVVVTADERLPVVVTDPARIDLVLTNLLSNAIKYSDPEKPERYVRIEPLPVDGGWWGLSVEDNGLGIPQDSLANIFDRFTRAHADRDAELGVDGSGLGLAITRESVVAIGGTIDCRSVPGQGTRFELRFPARGTMAGR